MELIWRALAQATIVTAIIIAVGYMLWRRQQRHAKAESVSNDDQS
jgi:preprotein translocase subunit YajC